MIGRFIFKWTDCINDTCEKIVLNDIRDIVPFPAFCDGLQKKVREMLGPFNNVSHQSTLKLPSGYSLTTLNHSGGFNSLLALLHANGIMFSNDNYLIIAHELLWLLVTCSKTGENFGRSLFGVVIPPLIDNDVLMSSDTKNKVNAVLLNLPDYALVRDWFDRQLLGETIMLDKNTLTSTDATLPDRLQTIRTLTDSYKSAGSCNLLRPQDFNIKLQSLNEQCLPPSEIIANFQDAIECCKDNDEKKQALQFVGLGRPSDIYTLSVVEKFENEGKKEPPENEPSSSEKEDDTDKKGKKKNTAVASSSLYLNRSNTVKKLFVETQLVNNTSRSMSTVYLRKEDERTLYKAMDNFKYRSDVLRAMGIPNKLGIMLHGIPGTGKSSVIQAVSTYLEKDMYYLRLNALRTNSALKKAFDHVVKGCSQRGGIVVMEDVDAMTDIVKKRVSNKDVSPLPTAMMRKPFNGARKNFGYYNDYYDNDNNKDDDNDELTLEYLLNVLQGSLTLDGTVFIATTNHLENLDDAFCRRGRFDVCIEMRPCDKYQLGRMFEKFFKRPLRKETLDAFEEDVYPAVQVVSRLVEYLFDEGVDETEVLAPFLRIIDNYAVLHQNPHPPRTPSG